MPDVNVEVVALNSQPEAPVVEQIVTAVQPQYTPHPRAKTVHQLTETMYREDF